MEAGKAFYRLPIKIPAADTESRLSSTAAVDGVDFWLGMDAQSEFE